MSFELYSQNPASNDQVNYFQTGMRPSAVKNAGWDIMADLAQFMALPTAGGTANAQTITNVRACGAWFTGMWVCWMPGATNTAAMTIQPDGLAAKNVFANGAAALAGQVVLGVPAIGRYDGTQVQLINPQRSTGSFTGTLNVGNTATTTVNYSILPDSQTAFAVFRSPVTATSSVTTLTITGIPSILVPASSTTTRTQALMQNNGALFVGWFDVTTTTWTGGIGTNPGAFTNAAANGVRQCVMTIPLS